MHKKFGINWTKIKGGCQSGRKVVTHNSKSDLPLVAWPGLGLAEAAGTAYIRQFNRRRITRRGSAAYGFGCILRTSCGHKVCALFVDFEKKIRQFFAVSS